jgi:hypothetical protein
MVQAKKHTLQEVMRFGAQLIGTEDLDPVYCALYRAKLPKKQLYRLLLAYFCFYHLGVSARISEEEGDAFWDVMEIAARNRVCSHLPAEFTRWPRGSERRHFRGDKCVEAVRKVRKNSEGKNELGVGPVPEHTIGLFFEMAQMVDFVGFMKVVQVFPMMGPWVAFKVADIMERVLGASIEFPNDLALLYKEPRAALDMLDVPAEEASQRLLGYFSHYAAPPSYERRCNIQEVETCLCKTRSFWHGKYYIGKDIHEIRKGLVGWGETADRLLRVMPEEVEQGLFQ